MKDPSHDPFPIIIYCFSSNWSPLATIGQIFTPPEAVAGPFFLLSCDNPNESPFNTVQLLHNWHFAPSVSNVLPSRGSWGSLRRVAGRSGESRPGYEETLSGQQSAANILHPVPPLVGFHPVSRITSAAPCFVKLSMTLSICHPEPAEG